MIVSKHYHKDNELGKLKVKVFRHDKDGQLKVGGKKLQEKFLQASVVIKVHDGKLMVRKTDKCLFNLKIQDGKLKMIEDYLKHEEGGEDFV